MELILFYFYMGKEVYFEMTIEKVEMTGDYIEGEDDW